MILHLVREIGGLADLLAVDVGDDVADLDPGLLGAGTRDHFPHGDALRDALVVGRPVRGDRDAQRRVAADDGAVAALARLHLVDDVHRVFDGNRVAVDFGRALARRSGGRQADHLALGVHQRPSGVALDDVGVGLDEARQLVDVLAVEAVLGVDRHVGARHLAVERGQVPLAGAVSDGRDRIVLLDLLRRDLDGFELLGRIVDLQNGHIACGVVPDDLGLVLVIRVRVGDRDRRRGLNHVIVRHDDARLVDDDSRSCAFAAVERGVDENDAGGGVYALSFGCAAGALARAVYGRLTGDLTLRGLLRLRSVRLDGLGVRLVLAVLDRHSREASQDSAQNHSGQRGGHKRRRGPLVAFALRRRRSDGCPVRVSAH